MEKNKLMMIIIIVLLVVLLASVVGVSIFALRMLGASPEESDEEVLASRTAMLPLEMIQLVPVEGQLVTNLKQSSSDSSRHGINTGLTVGLNRSDEKSKEYTALLALIVEQESVVKSIATGLMRQKTYEELTVSDGQSILEKEIVAALQESFNTHLIVAAYLENMYLN